MLGVMKPVSKATFPFQEKTFEKLYKFAETPDWRKGMRVWKEVFNYEENPIREMKSLECDYAKPRPEVDLKNMKANSGLISNLPQDVIPRHLKAENGDDQIEGRYLVCEEFLLLWR